MATLALLGDALEGGAVSGQSRKPLRARGEVLYNGIICYRFIAEFDVKARIKLALAGGSVRMEPLASTSMDDEVVCETGYIHLLEEPKHGPGIVKPGSGRHNANFWSFSRQASIRVTVPHEQQQRGFEKRQALRAATENEKKNRKRKKKKPKKT